MGAGRTLIDQENRNGNIRERNMSEREGFMKRIVMVVLTVVLLAGCGASSGFSKDSAAASETWEEAKWEEAVEETSEDGYAMTSYDYGENDLESGSAESGAGDISGSEAGNRKLIRNVYMNMETKEFDVFLEELSEQIRACKGYVEHSDISGSSYSYRGRKYASMTARIPADQLDGFISGVSDLANVTNKSESVEDITLQYVDTESRKKALEVEQERLLDLLEKAESVEDIIAIETRLSEVRYELESYGSKLRTYDNQVNYSTVTMDICEVERETPVEEKNAWYRMKNGFAESIYNIGQGIKIFAIGFVANIPYIVVFAVILFVLYKFVKIIYHRILKKKEKPVIGNDKEKKE